MYNKNSLAHKSIKNSLFNVIGFIWPIGLSLAFTPYIVHNLGKEAYGIFSIVSMVMGYFAFLNLGLGGAGLKYVSEYYAKKDYDTVNSIINILLLIYGILGIIGLISIVSLANILTTKVFKIPLDMVNVTKFAFYIAGFGFLATLLKSIFQSVPKALYRFDIENKISIIFGSLSTLCVVLVLFLGYGLKQVVVIRFGIGFLILIVYFIVLKKLLPFYKLKITFDKKLIKKLFSFGVYDLFIQISNVISNHADKTIIGIMLGPAWLTYFAVPKNLTQRLNGFVFKLSEIIFPLSSNLSSTYQKKRLINIYLKLSRVTLTIKLAVYITLIIFSYKILYFWMGQDFADEGSHVMIFLCLGFMLQSIGHITGLTNLGYGKPKINAIFGFVNIILFVILLIPATKLYGINGAAFAFALSKTSVIVMIFIINKFTIDISNYLYFKKVFLKPLIAAVFQILIVKLLIFNITNNVFFLISSIIFSILLYFFIAFIIKTYDRDEIEKILTFFNNVIFSKTNSK